MSQGIYSALSGIKLKEEELETVAHNLANATTNGYKENRISFSSVLSKFQGTESDGSQSTPFVEVGSRTIDLSQGPVLSTSNYLDVALQGKGFLEVQTAQGTFYTRNGSLALNANQELVLQSGGKVSGATGAIRISKPGTVEIATTGVIKVDNEEIGKIKIVTFDQEDALEPTGASLYKMKEGVSTKLDADTQVLQGKLESSNTNVVRNLVKLIQISREYQSYQKVISAQSKLEQEAASTVGRITT